ncbi:MAG TPA: Gfo/Idh/MocA family oxidoreductase [Planctomycetes bacterium]|nr:Gfo/Idh/MocA family oxidoreductase [Planctomycetota bacterium]
MASRSGFGFGIVGCGMIADFHARAIQAMKGGRLVCVHDCIPRSAQRVGETFAVPWYTDLKKFLKHPGLDVVTIATPSGAHLEPSLAAIKAGKHLAIEKPLEVTLERCDRIIDAAGRAKVKVAGIFPSRFGGSLLEVKKAVDAGRLGRPSAGIAVIPWYRTQAYYDSGGWRGTWKLDGGGALMNQSIHTIDILQWLMGPVKEIAALADLLAHQRIEVEDTASAALRFASGALGSIVGTTAAFPGTPRRVELYGDQGSIVIVDTEIVTWQFAKPLAGDKTVIRKYGPNPKKLTARGAADPKAISFEGHKLQFENLAESLSKQTPLLVDAVEARRAVEVILGIYASALSGKAARLPLKKTPSRRPFRKGEKKRPGAAK